MPRMSPWTVRTERMPSGKDPWIGLVTVPKMPRSSSFATTRWNSYSRSSSRRTHSSKKCTASNTRTSTAEICNGCEPGSEMSKRSSRVSEEDYLAWLGTQLRDEEPNPNRGYWGLLRAMYEKEFTWTV